MLALSFTLTAVAENGKVTYKGNADKIIFAPGSDYSPTDLFPEFKGVMPGDSLTQKITVKNDASDKVKVKIYIRSLGAHKDSEKFLSKLQMSVKKSDDNKMGYMFDAAASEPAQLKEWLCLGTLYSGGEVNLDVKLDVPTSLDNTYSQLVGYLDWEFMIEEYPVEEGDPKPPQTGESSAPRMWLFGILLLCAGIMLVLAVTKRKDSKK